MLLDTYSWIEFFQGSEEGRKVEEILRKKKCFTSITSISEVTNWCLKTKRNIRERISIIKYFTVLLPINEEIAELAGKINFENKKFIKNWGMMDSLIHATALIYNLTVLTGDEHFRNLKNVEML